MSDGKTSPDRIEQAIAAIRNGNKHRARFLIQAELRDNPDSIAAWSWACDLTKSTQEKILCLRRILSIDPDHQAARRYLDRLQAYAEQDQEPREDYSLRRAARSRPQQGLSVLDILLAPFAWLFSIRLPAALVLLLASLSFAGYAYYRVNTSFLGLTRLNFSQLAISPTRESIHAPDYRWELDFERSASSTFTGTVRFVAPIRIDELRILTHDVLVTSGDFADPEVVKTDVINHTFFWRAPYEPQPSGSINLLHIIPANKEVSAALYDIRNWQRVEITGREVYDLQAYSKEGEFLMSWKDTGCNTILVDQVKILEENAQN